MTLPEPFRSKTEDKSSEYIGCGFYQRSMNREEKAAFMLGAEALFEMLVESGVEFKSPTMGMLVELREKMEKNSLHPTLNCFVSGMKHQHKVLTTIYEAKLAVAVEALRFYADRSNWFLSSEFKKYKEFLEIDDADAERLDPTPNETKSIGGGIARKFLAKIEGMK